MSKIIGVICEDKSDLEVFNEILQKYIKKSNYKIKKCISNGGGKIHSKCSAFVTSLVREGCELIFVLRDLDRNNVGEILQDLEKKVANDKPSIVVIPVVEIEAWLLTDPKALRKVFKLCRIPRIHSNPETYDNPKKELSSIIKKNRKMQHTRYTNTIDNQKLAKIISLSMLRKCESFLPLDCFIKKNLCDKD